MRRTPTIADVVCADSAISGAWTSLICALVMRLACSIAVQSLGVAYQITRNIILKPNQKEINAHAARRPLTALATTTLRNYLSSPHFYPASDRQSPVLIPS